MPQIPNYSQGSPHKVNIFWFPLFLVFFLENFLLLDKILAFWPQIFLQDKLVVNADLNVLITKAYVCFSLMYVPVTYTNFSSKEHA